MLVEDFYTVIDRQVDGEATVFTVALNPSCKVYEGHFPGEPVAPGVCNIQMLKECAELVAGKPLTLRAISQCRMTKLITPKECPTLQVQVQLDGEKLTGSILHCEEVCLTIKGEAV